MVQRSPKQNLAKGDSLQQLLSIPFIIHILALMGRGSVQVRLALCYILKQIYRRPELHRADVQISLAMVLSLNVDGSVKVQKGNLTIACRAWAKLGTGCSIGDTPTGNTHILLTASSRSQ